MMEPDGDTMGRLTLCSDGFRQPMPTIRYANGVNDANDAYQYKLMVRRKQPMDWMVAVVGHSVTDGTNGDTI